MNINFGEKDPRILEKMFENMLDKYPEGLNECPLSQEEMDNVLKAVSNVLKHQYKIDLDDTGYDDRYNDGLKDAREIIIKLHTMSPIVRKKIFNEDYVKEILLTYTLKEIDEKIKAYEQKQNKIKVGDEVYYLDSTHKSVVTSITDGNVVCITAAGKWAINNVSELHKTGKHYDIQSILDGLKEDS